MLDESPHKLQVRIIDEPVLDEFGQQVGESSERWETVANCFCHDNSQMRQVLVNGVLWTYSYHVVYEGEKIPLDTKIRCVDGCCNVVGMGHVKKNAKCYGADFPNRCDIWV